MSTEPGPKILVQGDVGTGKTWALRELPDLGLKTFVLMTEQGFEAFLDKPEIHYHFVAPRSGNFGSMADFVEKSVLKLTIDSLAKVNDPQRGSATQFLDLLKTLSNFKDDRTGEVFGAVDDWGPDHVLVIDTLTGTSRMILESVTGSRSIRTYAEWGVAQDQQMQLIEKLASLRCSVIVNAHLEPERDEVTGRIRLYPSAIGRKLAPTIARHFGEVLLARRDGSKFFWSTASADASTKSRLLDMSDNLPQSYGLVFNKWKEKLSQAR